MKKINFKWLLLSIILSIASINTAWAVTYNPSGVAQQTMQSQQVMQTGGAYNGTVYEPFDNSTPSEQSEVGASYSPAKAPSGPRHTPLTPGDPGQGPSPVGEPWIMVLFAALFAGFIAIRQYKRKMTQSTNMKNTNRFIAVLGLLLTLSVGQMWADRTYDGTEKLYIKNAKPYYRENDQDKTWSSTWIQESSQYMHIAFRTTHDGDVTWATATYYKGGSNAYDENAIYEVVVPSGTWQYLLIVRSGSSTAGWGWNNTGEISFSTTQNMITNFKIDDGYAAWAYVPLTVSANDPVYVYFDNSNANWDNKIQFVIGHSTYGRAYPLVKLAGTKLAYKNLEDVYDGSWSDATYYAVAQKSTDLTSADGASNYDYSSVTSNATKYTAAYRNRNAFDLSANNTFLCTTSTGDNGTAWSITYKSGGYSDLNNTQTIYKSLNNSTSSADVGTVTITTTKLTGNVTGSENNSTATIGSSASNTSADAVITATVSLSVSENTGYIFDGWATTANGDVVVGSNTSPWTYTANSANTYYAKFHYSSTSITLDKNGGSADGSVTATYDSNTLTDYDAAEPTGEYALTGYYTSTDELIIDATGHLVASTSYTDGSGNWNSESSSLTLYAHWSLNRTITYHGNGNTGGSAPSAGVYENGATATVATKGSLEKTGYSFTGWNTESDGSGDPYAVGATFPISSNMDLYAQWSEDKHDIIINHGTGDTKAGVVTTATITCDSADEGKKFNGWDITGTYSLVGEGASLSDREITLHASTDLTVTATYTNRTYKKVYFQNKNGWSKVHAYVWKESGTSNTWPGVEITEQTECVNGMTFHYYLFYTDDNEEGDDATSQANWDQVIFSNNGSSQTQDLSLTSGNYYTPGEAKNSTGNDPTADEWYLKGDWDSWSTGTAFSFSTPCGYGTVDKDSWAAATSHAFKIYRSTTSEWWRYDGTVSLGSELALTNASGSDNTYSPTTASDYQFRLDVSDMNNPVLTLVDKNAEGYTVTLRAGANGSVTNAGSLMIYEAMNTEITAVPDPGYNFASWSVDADHADHVTITGTNPAIITAKDASAEGAVITANFNNTNMIYFDKSAVVGVWSGDDVYVTFFNDNNHWVEYYEGSERKERVKMQNWVVGLMSKKMDKIPNSNIYYTSTDTDSDGDSEATQWYMFTDKNMVNEGTTWEQAAVCRADYNSACNIFVVENYVEKSVAKTGFYYGYWMKYNETTPGIKLHIYEKGGTTNIEGSPFTFSTLEAGSTEFTVTVPLAVANNSYGIELKGDNGIYYKNNGNLTSSECTNWDYVERQATRGTITTTAAGDYKITLSCANKLFLSVEYPLQVGDYRIVYSGPMDTTSTVHTHSSKIIRQLRAGETSRKDTVSFYVIDDGEGDPDWSITLQKCTALTPDITWENACGSATHTSAALSMTGKQGVYIFPLTLESSGGCDGITLSTPKKYTGNFYIRTDGAKGGWEAYKKATDNCMGYSNFSEGHSGYGFYYCHFGRTNDNVKFVVANDYSPEVSLTLDGGDYIPSDGANKGKLPYDANIRFMYDSVTNVVRRAYLNGSSYGETKYLLLRGDSKIKRADVDKAFVDNDTTFTDNGNWIYQLDLKAQPGARVRLTSNYRFNNTDHMQYFKGSDADEWTDASTEQILGGSGTDWSTLRIIYDFKTNHLVSAWLATDDPVVGPKPIFADVMIVRAGQEAPVQITFGKNGSGEDGKLTDVGIVYSVMKFDKSTVNGSGSPYERSLFFISFPFDVKISEIFGFGGFCNQWYLEYYDGKGRAENGFWAESATNWKFITDRTATLKANEGYVLALDLDLMGTTSSVWDNTSEVCLYFPSADTIHNIQATTKSVDITQTGYLCTIDRYQGGATGLSSDYDRRIKDSYWHCIGVPSFANKVLDIHDGDHDGEAEGTAEYWTAEDLPYFYEWNKTTNEMTVRSTTNFTFVPMNAYLVQYSQSSLNWDAVNGVVASSVARRRSAELEQSCEFNLSLTKNGNEMDHTYVRLINKEGVTEGFDFGQDLSKEMNAYTANIYTMIGYEKAAANSMPLNSSETTIIPVGVKLKQGGDYTFAMPDGTNGVGVVLVDNVANTRTNLALTDYTVNLTAGTYDERFYLEISPIVQSPTGIEQTSSDSKDSVRKVMVDGILYIVKDGRIYDATGTRVQ